MYFIQDKHCTMCGFSSYHTILMAPHQRTGTDHQSVPVSRGWTSSSKIWEPTTSHWMKQSTRLRTALCGGWCLRMALCTPNGACQKRRKSQTNQDMQMHKTYFCRQHRSNSVGSNLTVASLDPDMMTFSSYWRQRTEPVWPCSTWTHSRLPRSHIFTVTHSNHFQFLFWRARYTLCQVSVLNVHNWRALRGFIH